MKSYILFAHWHVKKDYNFDTNNIIRQTIEQVRVLCENELTC
jgi:hypothetical protein